MAEQLTLPRLGQGMESGTIVRWLKSEGDQVEKGEPLYELDTEKVTQEVEADASGVLLKILVQEGEVPVGRPVAVIGEEGEEVPADAGGNGASPEQTAEREREDAEESAEKPAVAPKRDAERDRGRAASAESASEQPTEITPPPAEPRRDGGRIKASPLARRLAKERGIELSSLSGTGPEGRIVAEDVERAAAAPKSWAAQAPASAEIEVVPFNQMRRTIARRMTQAWETPHFQIAMTADMRASIRLRTRLLERTAEGEPRPTFSDVLTKVCALALMRHRDVNAHFTGDEVHLFPTANIGIAVAVPHGLVVPVITNCERKSIPEIATARADLVQRTRNGKLKQADLEDGTFTISNLGPYGIEQFIAVLNPPQAAILAVGSTEEKPVARNGQLEVRPVMTMTITCDHRAIDGADGAGFLRTVKELLEEPALAL